MKIPIEIKATAENVFAAITTNKGFSGWWAKVCDINCVPGGISCVKFLKPGFTEEMCFKTIGIEPLQRLQWLCVKNNVFESWIGSTLTFNIVDKGAVAELIFVHEGADDEWEQSPEYPDTYAGWDFFMQSLKKYCETGKGNAWG